MDTTNDPGDREAQRPDVLRQSYCPVFFRLRNGRRIARKRAVATILLIFLALFSTNWMIVRLGGMRFWTVPNVLPWVAGTVCYGGYFWADRYLCGLARDLREIPSDWVEEGPKECPPAPSLPG